nr:g-type lectin s-receptor-like serine/threonine-protein kinase [Quercus suber]
MAPDALAPALGGILCCIGVAAGVSPGVAADASFGPSYSQPAENFVQGKELKDGDELASANENFRLGFFKLSGKAYLGIWYNRNNEKPSSYANRRTPIADKSSVLTIDDYGNLKISYSGDQSLVLCSVQGASNSSAILLDTGNFRLHQIMNSDRSTKWNMRQSFDNTTDTLLPGLKLGVNNRTGDVPDIGSFTLNMDPKNTTQLIILWRGNIHSSTGPLNNGHSSSISYGLLNKHLNFGFISNENVTHFSYSVNKDFSMVPRFSIDYGGALLGFRYSTVYSEVLCISSDPSLSVGLGCVKQKLSGCRSLYDAVKGNYGSISTDGFKSNNSDNLNFYHYQAECLNNYSFGHFSTAYNNCSGEIQSTGQVLEPIQKEAHKRYASMYPKVSLLVKQMYLTDALDAYMKTTAYDAWL